VTSLAVFVNEPQPPLTIPRERGIFCAIIPPRGRSFATFTLLTRRPYYAFEMRELVAAFVIFVALSVVARGHPDRFVPRPTAPMPAVNVP
jgi:hypothetical protein